MTDPTLLLVGIPLTAEERAALARDLKVDEADLPAAVALRVRRMAESQLRYERRLAAYAAAEAAGTLFVARYWQHFELDEEKFLTPQEAASFLRAGEDDDRLSPEGVFDGDGNDLGWSATGGWPAGSPYADS